MRCAAALVGQAGESAPERAERLRLFEIPGACPPYEAAWIRRDKGVILGDLAGFYRAFGFEPEGQEGTRPDHLGAICEYLSLIRLMEAKALQAGREEEADVALEAFVNCLRDHLADWISPFCQRLRQVTCSQPMLNAADGLEQAWQLTAVPVGLPHFEQLEECPEPELNEGTPYECEMGGSNCPDDECGSDGTVELTTSASASVATGQTLPESTNERN